MQSVAVEARPKASRPESKGLFPAVRLVDAQQLSQYEGIWEKLCASAVVPNPFYAPWMILAAIKHKIEQENVKFLLVFGPPDKNGTAPLRAFFPLQVQSKCLHLPIRTLAFWQHRYCFLATPLIDSAYVREALEMFWRWFEQNPLGCRILDTNYLAADGPFHSVWADFAIGRCSLVLNEHPRPVQAPSRSGDAYISALLSPNHQRDNRRKERRLRELGTVEYHRVENILDVDRWVDEFLDLEASGWKGRSEGAAVAKRSPDSSYFRTIVRESFLRNRVWLMSLRLNGKAIAMKCALLTEDAGFSFKIAYAEDYWKYSPGVLLELEHLRWLRDDPRIRWSDTCTSPRHPMYGEISNERRIIRRTLFSNSSRLGDFYISTLPLLRWVKNQVRPNTGPEYFRISTKEKVTG